MACSPWGHTARSGHTTWWVREAQGHSSSSVSWLVPSACPLHIGWALKALVGVHLQVFGRFFDNRFYDALEMGVDSYVGINAFGSSATGAGLGSKVCHPLNAQACSSRPEVHTSSCNLLAFGLSHLPVRLSGSQCNGSNWTATLMPGMGLLVFFFATAALHAVHGREV